jgi:hypothetical protein
MKTIYLILLGVCILVMPQFVSAQGKEKKPEWATPDYRRSLDMSTLQTIVEEGHYQEARLKAQEEVERRRRMTVGMTDIWLKATPLAEYGEVKNGKQIWYFLYQEPDRPSYQINEVERVTVTERYPFSARAFVPGMAQIHKGSTGKGIAFIVGEVASIGGIVAFEGLRASYESKVNSTHNAADRKRYIDNTSTMQNIRNGFIAGAAAIYVWNVIDGAVAKGRGHVVIGQAQMKINPYASTQSSGVMLSLNF